MFFFENLIYSIFIKMVAVVIIMVIETVFYLNILQVGWNVAYTFA